jgi:S1-C subfamily serine protease
VNAVVGLIERVLPATVHLQARIPDAHPSSKILGTERMGSGTIVDADGLVLTVNYVVLGGEQVKVTLLDQRSYMAEVVRHDFNSGLALVRIPEQRLPALPLRRSTDLALGDDIFMVASVGEGAARVANGGSATSVPSTPTGSTSRPCRHVDRDEPRPGGRPLLDTLGASSGSYRST